MSERSVLSPSLPPRIITADDIAIGRAYKAGYEAGYEAALKANALGYGALWEVILARLPVGEWTTEDARAQVAAAGYAATRKQVFNALGYLTRKARVQRLGYGRYCTPPRGLPPAPAPTVVGGACEIRDDG